MLAEEEVFRSEICFKIIRNLPAPPLLLSSTRLGGPENNVPKLIMMIGDGEDDHVVITVVFVDDVVVNVIT